MDKTCSIVQDLLPLYEEDMLREQTKEFVDGHLAQCAACRAELDALKADVKPAPVSAQPLRDLKRQLRRKKLTAVLLAVTLALTLATAGFAYLTAPQYLPYSETEWAISRSPSALADDGSAADGLSDLSGAESISVSLLVPRLHRLRHGRHVQRHGQHAGRFPPLRSLSLGLLRHPDGRRPLQRLLQRCDHCILYRSSCVRTV